MVKCSECGFLAVRNAESRNLEEVEFKSRQDGNIGKQRYVLVPVCFAMATSFDEEAKELQKLPEYAERRNKIDEYISPNWSAITKTIIHKERQCNSFVQWHQGFTPKEHRQMIDAARERKLHLIELIVFVVVTLIAGIGGAIIGALIARGII
jgi:hypothetical protein